MSNHDLLLALLREINELGVMYLPNSSEPMISKSTIEQLIYDNIDQLENE